MDDVNNRKFIGMLRFDKSNIFKFTKTPTTLLMENLPEPDGDEALQMSLQLDMTTMTVTLTGPNYKLSARLQ